MTHFFKLSSDDFSNSNNWSIQRFSLGQRCKMKFRFTEKRNCIFHEDLTIFQGLQPSKVFGNSIRNLEIWLVIFFFEKIKIVPFLCISWHAESGCRSFKNFTVKFHFITVSWNVASLVFVFINLFWNKEEVKIKRAFLE